MNSTIKKSLDFIGKSNFVDAIFLLKKALRKNPHDIQALNILGQVQIKQADYKSAITNLEKSIAINAFDTEILSRLGYAYEKNNDYDKAIEAYRKSLVLNSNQGHVYDCLARTLAKDKQNYEAILYFIKALEFNPRDDDIHRNIGYVAKDTGLYDLTLKHYQIARELNPAEEKSLSCLIFNAHKDPNLGLKDFQRLAIEYCDQFISSPAKTYHQLVQARLDPTKTKLRIGFVSADLRCHPVSYYLLKVLQGMNQDHFEFIFYHNSPTEDSMTDEYKEIAISFHEIIKKTDAEIAELIFTDQIDILFDMSGFTSGHRLGVFKSNPAPVQVTHIGYFGTLGMQEMDFIIADQQLVKAGEEQYFTESVYKMNSCYVHCDSYDLPEASNQAPCIENGYITFGSMNSSHKISPRVIVTWSEILKRCPQAKLLIDNQFIKSESNKAFVEKRFKENDIPPNRLILRSSGPRRDFIQSYNDIDIALDPFPYGGGTSTIESLMMGVPVISLAGDRWVSRQSADFLINAGHQELIVKDIDEYIHKAVELASDKTTIDNYRKCLKQDLQASAMALETYIPSFEKALWDMWLLKSGAAT